LERNPLGTTKEINSTKKIPKQWLSVTGNKATRLHLCALNQESDFEKNSAKFDATSSWPGFDKKSSTKSLAYMGAVAGQTDMQVRGLSCCSHTKPHKHAAL
jgi:peptide methionine sulfoxide reductase MsrB